MKRILFAAAVATLLLVNCTSQESDKKNEVVIGIPSDFESLNPLFAFSFQDGNISELIFQSLVKHRWDYEKAELTNEPMLAVSWEWESDSSSIIVNIKDDVFWSDSVNLTVHDIVFSFDLYSDPIVQSRALGYFENFFAEEEGRIDTARTFEVISDYSIRINFKNNSRASLIDIDHPILPKHALMDIERAELINDEFNQNPITSGPFRVSKWIRNQALYLEADKQSGYFRPESITGLIFKVVPDYTSRILQLKKGELDLVEDIKSEDIDQLKEHDRLNIEAVGDRLYDYIGWNLVEIRDDEIYPNRFFGNRNVRRAMTHALNREEVLSEFMYNYGKLSAGPVSLLYKDAFDETDAPLSYDPELAKEILTKEGWEDTNDNGIVDKDGLEFSFDLYTSTGNPRRKFAATLFKNNLKVIGVDMNVKYLDFSALMGGILQKQFDAFMVGTAISLPINLTVQWHSDPNISRVNFSSYSNAEVDELLEKLEGKNSRKDYIAALKKVNKIIQNDQPYTFLYWLDNATAYNNRISNIDFNPLGVVHHCWEWSIN